MKAVSGFEPYVLNKKLKKVIDPLLYKEGRFVFIASPECENGVRDPASGVAPVLFEGEPLDLAAVAKVLGVDLFAENATRKRASAPRKGANGEADKRRVSHSLRDRETRSF